MFFTSKRATIKELREEIKKKSLFITSLERENTQLRFKIKNVQNSIKDFNAIKDNPFSLINSIINEFKD